MSAPFLRRRGFLTAGALSCLPAAVIAQPAGAGKTRELVLGQTCPLNGPAAQLGQQYRAGLQAVFDAANDRGGVAGATIRLVSLDDGYEPQRAAANASKLIADGAQMIVGPVGTPTTLAVEPLAKSAGIPIWAPFTGAESLRGADKGHIWHLRASYNAETREIVKHAASLLSQKNICMIVQDDGFGAAGEAGIREALPGSDAGMGVVVKIKRNTESVDEVRGRVAEVMAARPSAVVIVSTYLPVSFALQEFKRLGFVGNVYTLSFVGTDALSATLAQAKTPTRGVLISQVVPKPVKQARAVASRFAVDAEAWSLKPTHTVFEGYLAGQVFIESLRRLNGPFSSSRWQEVMSALNYDMGGFNIDFRTKANASKPNRAGSTFVEMSMLSSSGQVLG